MNTRSAGLFVLTAALVACGGAPATKPAEPEAPPPAPMFPSTYRAAPAEALLLRGATVLTGDGARIDDGDVWLENGLVKAVGRNLEAPGARVVDAKGRWVTPGIIDAHSHLGAYPSPGVWATSNGN